MTDKCKFCRTREAVESGYCASCAQFSKVLDRPASFLLRFSIRTLLLATLSIAIFGFVYRATPDGSMFFQVMLGVAYFSAWLIPAASIGWDLEKSITGMLDAMSWASLYCAVFTILFVVVFGRTLLH